MIKQEEIKRLAELKEFASEHKKLNETMKARVEAGENAQAGGWQLNPAVTPKQIVSWKSIAVRELGKAYCDNVQHNTKPREILSLKPAFSITAENAVRKSA